MQFTFLWAIYYVYFYEFLSDGWKFDTCNFQSMN